MISPNLGRFWLHNTEVRFFLAKPPGPTNDFFHVMMSMSTSGSNHLQKPINYGGWGYGGHWPSAWCLKKSCLEWCIPQKHTDRANRPNEKRLPGKILVQSRIESSSVYIAYVCHGGWKHLQRDESHGNKIKLYTTKTRNLRYTRQCLKVRGHLNPQKNRS